MNSLDIALKEKELEKILMICPLTVVTKDMQAVLCMQDILKELSKFYMKNQFNINNLLN